MCVFVRKSSAPSQKSITASMERGSHVQERASHGHHGEGSSIPNGIHPLPRDVASKIRGSVVAPSLASAVVELVYNAVDSGSTKVMVIVDMGSFCIQVKDNGRGMTLQDLYCCGSSGYTSKMHDSSSMGGDEDKAIPTYGFRGEALASLSQFCSLEITTVSRHEATKAFAKVIHSGHSAGITQSLDRHDPGTTVTCKDLFFNRPVVRKMLTGSPEGVELGRIVDCMRPIAMVNPAVSISVQDATTGATLLTTTRHPSVRHAFLDAIRSRNAEGLRSFDMAGAGGLRVSMLLSSPAEPSRTRDQQFLFVNGRLCARCPVHDSIEETYSALWVSSMGRQALESLDVNGPLQDTKRRRVSEGGRKVGAEPRRYPSFIVRISCPPNSCGFSEHENDKCEVEFSSWDEILSLCRGAMDIFLAENGCPKLKRWVRWGEPGLQSQGVGMSGRTRDGTSCGHAQGTSATVSCSRRNCSRNTAEKAAVAEKAAIADVQEAEEGNAIIGQSRVGVELEVVADDEWRMIEVAMQCASDSASDVTRGAKVQVEIVGEEEWGIVEAAIQTARLVGPSRVGCRKAAAKSSAGSFRLGLDAEDLMKSWPKGQYQAKALPPVYFDEARRVWTTREMNNPRTPSIVGDLKGCSGRHGLAQRFADWESPVLGAGTEYKILPSSSWGSVSGGRSTAVTRQMLVHARVVGQAFCKFIIAEAEGCLLCVDQHAADERVRYEEMQALLLASKDQVSARAGVGGGDGRLHKREGRHGEEVWSITRVSLNPPLAIRGLSAEEIGVLLRCGDSLEHWGFKLIGLGGPAPRMVEAPRIMGQVLGKDDLCDFLHELGSAVGTRIPPPQSVMKVLQSKACRGAIMFGDRLTKTQSYQVLAELGECDMPFQCAHGRPSVVPLLQHSGAAAWGGGTLSRPDLGKIRRLFKAKQQE